MTRREFTQLLLAMPLVSLAAQETSSPAREPTTQDDWLNWVQAVRGEPLDAESRRRLTDALKAQNELLARLRQFPLAEGSEPAFLFQPVPPQRKEAKR